jgi:hypothetical protein
MSGRPNKRSKPTEKTSARRIPKNVIKEMVRKGADFEAFDGEDLCRMLFGIVM